MPIPPSALKQEPVDQVLTITLTAHELAMLSWLAQEASLDGPADLLADFAADLAASWRNGGSDEREHAFAWFKRRGYTGKYITQHAAIAWRADVEAARQAEED